MTCVTYTYVCLFVFPCVGFELELSHLTPSRDCELTTTTHRLPRPVFAICTNRQEASNTTTPKAFPIVICCTTMSTLNESLTDKLLRLRRTAEAAEAGYAPFPCRKRKASESATTPATSSDADDKKTKSKNEDEEFHALLKRYKGTIEQIKQEQEKQQNDFANLKQRMDDLRAAYLFGLETVSALKDLQDAPDAILFGNFPQATRNKDADEKQDEEKVKDESAT